MPIYDYECAKCGSITEELQGFDDKPLSKCKRCKGRLVRIMSLSSFQLTGNGWYATDYAKGPGIPSKIAEENPAISGSDVTNNTVTESKPKKPRKSGMVNMEKSDVKG